MINVKLSPTNFNVREIITWPLGDISTLKGAPLKLVDKFTDIGSSITSNKNDINTRLAKSWTANNRKSII